MLKSLANKILNGLVKFGGPPAPFSRFCKRNGKFADLRICKLLVAKNNGTAVLIPNVKSVSAWPSQFPRFLRTNKLSSIKEEIPSQVSNLMSRFGLGSHRNEYIRIRISLLAKHLMVAMITVHAIQSAD